MPPKKRKGKGKRPGSSSNRKSSKKTKRKSGGKSASKKGKGGRRRSSSSGDDKKGGKRRFGGREKSGKSRRGEKPAPSGKKFLGRFHKNPQGFGFLISTDINQPDTYVSREEAAQLMNDDRVEFSIIQRGQRTAAQIHRIVERGKTRVIGVVHRDEHGSSVHDLQGEFFYLDKEKAREGEWVIAKIEKYPSSHKAGKVSIQRNLGRELSPEHDYDLAIAQFDIPVEFSPRALAQAEEARKNAVNATENRKDPLVPRVRASWSRALSGMTKWLTSAIAT